MAKQLGEDELRRVYHHVFLPPKLPQTSDDDTSIRQSLLNVTLGALEQLADTENTAMRHTIAAIKNLKNVNSLPEAAVSELELKRVLIDLADQQSAPVHVTSQNAAVLVTRKQHELIFETFELSPLNSQILSTKGRLTRRFPAHAVSVNTNLHARESLMPVVAKTLATMCIEPVLGTQPESYKAGTKHNERRDTTDPMMVTELFVGFLRGIGNPALVVSVTKNTRDEVLWAKALAPWRRSSMWLLIKVVLHIVITRSSGGTNALFKSVMIFVMSQILHAATERPFSSEELYSMNAKIVRRLHKLQTSSSPVDSVHAKSMVETTKTLARTGARISETWRALQERDASPLDLNMLSKLDIQQDTHVALPLLDNYIASMRSRSKATAATAFTPLSHLLRSQSALLPTLPDSNRPLFHYATANLQQFELWMAKELDRWVETGARHISDVCLRLNRLMEQYHKIASAHYSGNPEGMSVMILTLFDLFVACDKVAVRINPLLAEYPPEIPTDVLQNLLLPFPYQMDRLSKLESYLKHRLDNSRPELTGLISSTTSQNAFAVRYYDNSGSHQRLKRAIEHKAQQLKNDKQDEYRRKKTEYEQLDAKYSSTECEYVTVIVDNWCNPPETEQRHSYGCMKCYYRKIRDGTTIYVHEWSLPEDSVLAKVIVFELDVPQWHAAWRDARLFLLQKVLKGKRETARLNAKYQPSSNDPHLTSWLTQGTGNERIGLVSEAKPVVVTHYKAKLITEVDVESVCLENGLRYRYYDDASDQYIGPFSFDNKVPKTCTYRPTVPELQSYLFRSANSPDGEPPNGVIASQDKCPDNMSLDEYKELSCVPLGHNIQWVNILQQLAMPGVDFKKFVTTLVFLQCIYQTGPPGQDYYREAHAILRSDKKAFDLIAQLDAAVDRVKQNWESAQALSLFASIATRVLSLKSTTEDVCLPLLAKIREVTMDWTHLLRNAAHQTPDQESREMFLSKSVEAALICASTFDVPKKHVDRLLRSGAAVSTLVQASMVIQQCGTAELWKDQSVQLMRLRFVRFLHRYYKSISELSEGINDAIKQSWASYKPSLDGWAAVSPEADDWITTETSDREMRLHYNLLSGELLVNGVPLDQPPLQYRTQALYTTLFGNAIVEVMPATSTGFRFSTKRAFGGYGVQIGLQPGTADNLELIVQGERDRTVIEYVPGRVLGEDFPTHFVQDYIHWYNFRTGHVKFRPINDPWNPSSPATWILKKSLFGTWQLHKDETIVVGIQSNTAKTISHVLRPLANTRRTHCILQPDKLTLRIEIPVLRLGFRLSQGSPLLMSKEFPSMAVDSDQRLGTLIGFCNRLMLRSKIGERLLLLPEADLHYSRHQDHTLVRISNVDAIRQVHAIHIDPQLGRLVDSGDLGCKLYLAYLHALTAFCLPDPLIRKTGTEEALSMLDSCAVRSFSQLSQENVDMLGLIAKVSPGRACYPANKVEMQSVSWDNRLGFLSQHAKLRLSVEAIFDQARDAEIFHPELELQFPTLPQCDQLLRQRDSIRSSTFRVTGFGAEDHSLQHDKTYCSRERALGSESATNAAFMSNLMLRLGTERHFSSVSISQLWQKLCSLDRSLTIEGPETSLTSSQHCYAGILTQEKKLPNALAKLAPHFRKLSLDHTAKEHYSVAMWLSSMAFAKDADMEMLQMFALVCKTQGLTINVAPPANSYLLEHGLSRSRDALEKIVTTHAKAFESCPEVDAERWVNEKKDDYYLRRQALWKSAKSTAAKRLVDALVTQWTQRIPTTPDIPDAATYINMEHVMGLVRQKFQSWFDNNLLYQYLDDVTRSLHCRGVDKISLPSSSMMPSPAPFARGSVTGYFKVEDLFTVAAPQASLLGQTPSLESESSHIGGAASSKRPPRLRAVVDALGTSAQKSRYEQSYADDLKSSLKALENRDQDNAHRISLSTESLKTYRQQCEDRVDKIYEQLITAIEKVAHSTNERTVNQWPRVSPVLLLEQLAHDRYDHLPQAWRTSIIEYGVALTTLQRADRLVRLAESSQEIDMLKEYRNSGHQNWSPHDHPQSLLMEIESGIMIREVQEQIASEMRLPSSSGANAVMQLNMGEGKSTVIIPMVAAALADGSRLVRVIVAKPQSKQMAQMLIAKLGGLVKRRVYYMPFSRSLKLTSTAAAVMFRTLKDCMRTGGILLVQPEHILSFGLVSPECYITDKHSVGQPLMEMQDFLHRHSRDIVDESDENFSVRFELIYTMGNQQKIELAPERWTFMQQVLEIVMHSAPDVAERFPASIELRPNGAGAFPRIRLFRTDASEALKLAVASHIRSHGFEGFQMARQSEELRDAVFDYITSFEPKRDAVALVEASEFWDTCKAQLLLLRGILASGVLAFVFSQKRWRVNYGLALRSPPTKLAVPYRAKDNPTPRSEFSHPDVVVALTSLSYYYEGLTDDDMFTALGHLVDSDQADAEYQVWVKHAAGLDMSFHQLQGINLKDRFQCIVNLFPHLRKGKAVVDYFLSHIVFPKEMKQFPHKLSVSGWDIGKQKQHVTTGFSGTNDSRRLLPLFVEQLDLPKQKHTNALVLEYLLQPVNGVELMPATTIGRESSDAQALLATVLELKEPVQVILDVGAQILEFDNLGLAKEWLNLSDPSKEAVVFVNDADELCVVDRKDRVDLLQTSPFASRLDACLVFLDESHTRGIDLKLPLTSRAAVTLGAHLTKDRLVQACMRMRKLGHGQSVIFCVSQEIQARILENMRSYSSSTNITVADVLLWSVSETHTETRRSMPLWAVQGERFVRDAKTWKSMQDQDGKTTLSKGRADMLLEEEAQTIEHRYRPQLDDGSSARFANTGDLDLQRIAARCQEFDGLTFHASTLQEEQERELSPEIEQERQVQRAPPAEPVRHHLHKDVVDFALFGKWSESSDAYMPAFVSLKQTSAASHIDLAQLGKGKKLLLTADFAATVKQTGSGFQSDAFQRHVHWVLVGCSAKGDYADRIMIISEYEANLLLPRIKGEGSSTVLHKYKARCNAGYAPQEFSLFVAAARSTVPVVPRQLAVQLSLFAGQLYISSYQDYLEICKFLGISAQLLTKHMEQQGWKVGTDGFILKDAQGRRGGTSGLTKSPTNFFKILMSKIRKNGDGISKTDMGSLLAGRPFQQSHWEGDD